jgi:GNAT superfamily N-acetyltransferase
MENRDLSQSRLEFHPLTPERWEDFETLFGPRGACGGCWCMWWLIPHPQFNRQKGETNRQALKQLVESGRVPGLLAYALDQSLGQNSSAGRNVPAGWCALAPREAYVALENSRILKPVDDKTVWSVVCFYVAKPYRRQGVASALLSAAIEYARGQGANILEGYPVEPKKGQSPDVFVYTGLASTFRQLGFVEVARRSETRPIMRYYFGE